MNIILSGIKVYLPEKNSPLFSIPKLEIPQGQKLLLQGPSGKGKTTLLHLMAGLFPPNEGSIRVGENDLKYLSDNELCRLRRKHFGIIFQKLNLLEHLTALENILLTKRTLPAPNTLLEKTLAALDLSAKADVRSGNLSLGEQQRVAVARILMQTPDIVLADEPTSSLDDANAYSVMKSLFSLPESTTLIVVSHDHRIEAQFKDRLDFERFTQA